MSKIRGALYTATSVQVDCPHCGESIPAPCGSIFWTVGELERAISAEPDRTCDGCDAPIALRQQSKAALPLMLGAATTECKP